MFNIVVALYFTGHARGVTIFKPNWKNVIHQLCCWCYI